MKKIGCLFALVVLSGCNSTPNISTTPYYNAIASKCKAQFESPTDEQKTQCASKAHFKTILAERLYEDKFEIAYKKCQQTNSNEQEATACFQKQQKAYYDNYFKTNTEDTIPLSAY